MNGLKKRKYGFTDLQLLNLLLDSGNYEKAVTYVKRNTGINHPKLTQHIIDFDKPESFKELVTSDDFFCTSFSIVTLSLLLGNRNEIR